MRGHTLFIGCNGTHPHGCQVTSMFSHNDVIMLILHFSIFRDFWKLILNKKAMVCRERGSKNTTISGPSMAG